MSYIKDIKCFELLERKNVLTEVLLHEIQTQGRQKDFKYDRLLFCED